VSCPDAPKNERCGHKNQTGEEWPQAVLCFHYTVVATSKFNSEPVAETAGEDGSILVSSDFRPRDVGNSPKNHTKTAC
jgi:hypothetical protein